MLVEFFASFKYFLSLKTESRDSFWDSIPVIKKYSHDWISLTKASSPGAKK